MGKTNFTFDPDALIDGSESADLVFDNGRPFIRSTRYGADTLRMEIGKAKEKLGNVNNDEEVEAIEAVLSMCDSYLESEDATSTCSFEYDMGELLEAAPFLFRDAGDVLRFAGDSSVVGVKETYGGRYMLIVETDYRKPRPFDVREP